MPDYEAMTVDELDAASVALKNQIEALRDERRVIRAMRDVLVEREHIAAAIERAGLTGVVAIPGAAEIQLRIARGAASVEEG